MNQKRPFHLNKKWLWAISVFLLLSAIIFFPSWASILFLVAGLISLPIDKFKTFLESKGLRGATKSVLVAVIFLAGCVLAPSSANNQVQSQDIQETIEQEEGKSSEAIENLDEPPQETILADSQEPEELPPEDTDTQQESIPVYNPSEEEQQEQTKPPEESTEITDEPPVQETTIEETPADTVPVQSTGVYVGSIDSDKYHDPDCRWAEEILSENEIWFDTEEAAVADGYSPCGTCKP